jgi:hypothetical protein
MDHEPKRRKAYTSVRLAPALHDQIVTAARIAGRSLTQEIKLRLAVAGLAMSGAFGSGPHSEPVAQTAP